MLAKENQTLATVPLHHSRNGDAPKSEQQNKVQSLTEEKATHASRDKAKTILIVLGDRPIHFTTRKSEVFRPSMCAGRTVCVGGSDVLIIDPVNLLATSDIASYVGRDVNLPVQITTIGYEQNRGVEVCSHSCKKILRTSFENPSAFKGHWNLLGCQTGHVSHLYQAATVSATRTRYSDIVCKASETYCRDVVPVACGRVRDCRKRGSKACRGSWRRC